MKRQKLETYLGKRKYDEMLSGVKKQKIYDIDAIDMENTKYHVFLYF